MKVDFSAIKQGKYWLVLLAFTAAAFGDVSILFPSGISIDLPDGEYQIVGVEPPPVVPPVVPEPEPPVVPPEPPEYDYPVPVLTYTPDYPPVGQYSVAGACEAIHSSSSPTVTLGKGEKLSTAIQRLKTMSPNGGVVEIPAGHTRQCDSVRLDKKSYFPDGLTLRGVGDTQPRFYCRAKDDPEGKDYKLGGTIPFDIVEPTWLTAAYEEHGRLLIENIHIDGYKGAMKLGSTGSTVIRNSWMHHGPHSGIASVNTGSGKVFKDQIQIPNRFSLEVCGSEVSHYGQANHTHNFYMHRGLGGGGESPDLMALGAFDTWSEVTIVDSFIHSAGWASVIKSIANRNNIINNRLYSEWTTDPSFILKQSQMTIDVPSCSYNVITGNDIRNFKPEKSAGGSSVIGLRGRRTAMRGCDTPFLWSPYAKSSVDGVPVKLFPGHPMNTAQWWTDLGGKILFPTYLENNTITVEGEFSGRQTAVKIYGTYPIYEGPKKVTCQLPAPDTWYERSRVYSKGNTFVGYDPEKIYVEQTSQHSPKCANENPEGPGPTSGMVEDLGNIVK